jgi:hypothetical protein
MPTTSKYNKLLSLQTTILAVATVAILFVWQGNKAFSLWDEGFLWYGAQRVTLGEVPIRDFMAYDPGRYYWVAAIMEICRNNGIMVLRVALAIFQAMGLSVGLLLIARTTKKQSLGYLLITTLILTVWMFPRHKLCDISLSIFLIGVLTYLVENAVTRRYFFAGFWLGVIAVFGRNHGVYGAISSLAVIGWLSIKRSEGSNPARGLLFWSAGVVIGYCPVLLMMLLFPGFAPAFLEDVGYLFEIKATNIPIPVPWPWRVHFTSLPVEEAIRNTLIGSFFVGMLIFGVLSVLWVIKQKLLRRPVCPTLVAASFLALPYAHFAYSRADISHLAQGIFPTMVGILTLLSRQPARIKWPLTLTLGVTSIWVMYVFQPGWECRADRCVSVDISHDALLIDPATASDISLLRALADRYAQRGRSFIAAPFWPGAYALLERKAPMLEIYPLLARSKAFELDEIKRIEAAQPGFVLIDDTPLDGRDALRFKNTHPLIYQYISNNFILLPDSSKPAYQIYKSEKSTQ